MFLHLAGSGIGQMDNPVYDAITVKKSTKGENEGSVFSVANCYLKHLNTGKLNTNNNSKSVVDMFIDQSVLLLPELEATILFEICMFMFQFLL